MICYCQSKSICKRYLLRLNCSTSKSLFSVDEAPKYIYFDLIFFLIFSLVKLREIMIFVLNPFAPNDDFARRWKSSLVAR